MYHGHYYLLIGGSISINIQLFSPLIPINILDWPILGRYFPPIFQDKVEFLQPRWDVDHSYVVIWRFPKLRVPPNHPFLCGIFHDKPSSYWGTGYPHLWNPHMIHEEHQQRLIEERLATLLCLGSPQDNQLIHEGFPWISAQKSKWCGWSWFIYIIYAILKCWVYRLEWYMLHFCTIDVLVRIMLYVFVQIWYTYCIA